MPHDHSHAPSLTTDSLTPAFRWSVGLNVAYVIIEAGAGLWTGSLALLADAGHNLMDVAGLLMAWGAVYLAGRMPTRSYSYGFGRATMLAALANAGAILLGAGVVIWEAVHRFSQPVDLPGGTIMAVALVGIAVNAGSALLFRSHGDDLNARGAYLHLATDAAVSLGVVLGAGAIMLTGWEWIDPVIAIAVSVMIAFTAWQLLRKATAAIMDRVPENVDPAAVRDFLTAQPGVAAVHDLHIWPLSTTRAALTAHLVMPAGAPGDDFLQNVAEELEHHHHIGHTTLQTETGTQDHCPTVG